jgi:hypothetical protein
MLIHKALDHNLRQRIWRVICGFQCLNTDKGDVLLQHDLLLGYQEIVLKKDVVPALKLREYLKTQEREDDLIRVNAEKVYQEVLEKSKEAN